MVGCGVISKALLIVLGVSLLCVGPAYSWGEKGHDIVAYITEANLTAPARKQVKSLLGKESLAEASYWPDRLRLEMREMDSLHYINLPPFKGLETERVSLLQPSREEANRVGADAEEMKNWRWLKPELVAQSIC